MRDRLSILRHYLAARRNFTRWQTRESLESWQDRQVQAHLRCVLPKSGYYRKCFAGKRPEDWREFPVSRKADLMASFDEWNTVGIPLKEASSVAQEAERSRDFSPTIRGMAVGLSSGTTGSRGVFLVSPTERRRWAGTLLARALRGTLHQKRRAALFLRADSPLYQTVGSKRMSFSFFDLFAPFETHWSRLKSLRPTLLAAPPSALVQLARQSGAGDLLGQPSILLSVADVLDEADRRIIETGFGQAVGQLYQATEGFLAATCPEGKLHWNEDAIVVQKEWIDEAKTRYYPVITDFRRTTQPILRFRLDDVIVAGEQGRCACGSVFERLEKIEGRHDDLFSLQALDADRPVTVFPDFVRRALILALPAGVDYTVTQTAVDEWEVGTNQPGHEEMILAEIERLCQDLRARPVKVRFTPWTPPPADAKRRRVRRAIPSP
jgi:putative adenylate-forming enzyme